MENNRRDILALVLIAFSFAAIITISIVYMNFSKDTESGEKLFNALLPLFSTWVGTVLVFYFGKESFESASKKYEQIINKLSPELLADVPARQVMIDKLTMVSLPITDTRIANAEIRNLLTFLDSIGKSRLPVMQGNKIKYIIHRSIFTEELAKGTNAPLATIAALATDYPVIAQFGTIKEGDTVNAARKLMQANGYKDVFVVDGNENLVGWLTDTQVLRYMDVRN